MKELYKFMQNKVENQGQYEIFDTTKGHRILELNGKNWFAVVKGQRGDILVGSDSGHKKKKSVQKGQYYLVKFKNDPEFKDMPHLFLEISKNFSEWVLPNDLPNQKGDRVKVIKTKNKIASDKIKEHIKIS